MTPKKYSNTQRATDIFGTNFKSSIQYASKVIEDFVSNEIIQKNGLVKPEKFPLVQKAHLWGYVFYLWYHNKEAVKQVKTDITFRKDMMDMIAVYLKRTIHSENISKYLNKKKEVVYVAKSHLVLFVHYFVSSIPDVKIPFLKKVSEPNSLMDRLIEEEEKKYRTLINEIDEKITNPKVKVTDGSDKATVTVTLRDRDTVTQ